MYLQNLLMFNSGAVRTLQLKMGFRNDGRPKPTILVGTNGSGKTGVLSTVADALIEIAASKFQDVAPATSSGRSFFKLVGAKTTTVLEKFELLAAVFKDQSEAFYYVAHHGELDAAAIGSALDDYGPYKNLTQNSPGNPKAITGDGQKIEQNFHAGAYAFFPSSRFESPYWSNNEFLERDPDADFTQRIRSRLGKPLVVQSSIQALKPWIIDIILDASVDAVQLYAASNLDSLKQASQIHLISGQAYQNICLVLQKILKNPGARIARLHRGFGDRRICIVDQNGILLPTLDNLSAGQATLLGIFGTIVRYADRVNIAQSTTEIEGTIVVDEIDAHLHADLQYEVLPDLMALFPKIQFVVSSHAPLFPLGMERTFGTDGFSLIEMPSGTTISAERYSEFAASLTYFQDTQRFEKILQDKISHVTRPIILCEGETDPKYLQSAAEALGMSDIASRVEYDWVGQKSRGGAQGGGKDSLDTALRFLKNNPRCVSRKTVLLYDCDTKKMQEDLDNLHVRMLPSNPDNVIRKRGIENMLPEQVFEERFFEKKHTKNGDEDVTVRSLNKKTLCDYLCLQKDPEVFGRFRQILEELSELLL